jgi:hypothetical protein
LKTITKFKLSSKIIIFKQINFVLYNINLIKKFVKNEEESKIQLDQTPKNYLSKFSKVGFLKGPLSIKSNATNILSKDKLILFSILILTSKSKLNGLPLNHLIKNVYLKGYLTLYSKDNNL